MEWGIGCCCKRCTVGFWGLCDQSVWDPGIDFPASWTRLMSRTKDNLADCDILVIGRYSFSSPYTDQPDTNIKRDAVASWITAGGVLFVIHEFYGSPSIVPSSVAFALNDCLDRIGSASRAGIVTGIAPNGTDWPQGTFATSVSHPLLTGVDKLWISAPGHMTLGSATLVFEARKPPSFPYVTILSVEAFGAGHIVFCSDFSMLNNPNAFLAIAANGNKINKMLENLCSL